MSSLCDKKLDKFVTIMSQVSTIYATHLYTKSTTGAIDKNDYLAREYAQKREPDRSPFKTQISIMTKIDKILYRTNIQKRATFR